MMNIIFAGMVLFSFLFALFSGRMELLSKAAMEQAGSAVSLVLSLAGTLCLWSGLMKIAEEAKITSLLCKALSPVTRRLFRGIDPKGEAAGAASMNIVANLLGLGNAATPLGIRAITEMAKEQHAQGRATNAMAMFVVLNTASIQIIPATTAFLRMQNGAAQPMDILPAVWLASAGSVLVGILMAKLLSDVWSEKQ